MKKKLTISVDQRVYEGLHRRIGRRRISRFIETLVRPHVVDEELEAGYRALAEDEQDAQEALEWIEGTVGDIADETR
jgi:hypothetical protein